MQLVLQSRLFAAVLMAGAPVSAAQALVAAQNPDGIYAVDITTRQGECDKIYHWMISVSGGRVTSAGDTPMEASGQINGRGVVALSFERFGQAATVTGRLAKGSGSGTWASKTMQCAGSWRALRRG